VFGIAGAAGAPPNGDLVGGTNAAATGLSLPLGAAAGGNRLGPNADSTGRAGEGALVDGNDGIGVETGAASLGNADTAPKGLFMAGANGEAANWGWRKGGREVGAVEDGREGSGVAAVKRGARAEVDRGDVGIGATGSTDSTSPSITSG